MNKAAYTFISIIGLAAVGLVWLLPAEPLVAIVQDGLPSLVVFIAVALCAEALAIDFGTGRQARSSLAFLPFLTCAVLFEPIVSVVVVASVIATSNFVLRRQDVTKGIFNVSQVVVAVGLAAVTYQALGGSPESHALNYLGFLGVAAVFFLTNILLISGALSAIRGQSIKVIIPQVAGPRGSNLWYDLLASPIAIVPALLYPSYGSKGILIIVLPLLLIRHSYQSKLQLEEANRDLLAVLVKAIETRDPYTSGHSLRVAELARLIANDLGIPIRRVGQIERAALLHDIGKIDSIYAAVIRKPYDLNSDERTLIRTHATKGADLLESLSSVSAEVIRAVRHHHERYDGTGYPSGLRAEEIPLAARIIMVCDSVDAMLSDRPYRRALPLSKVHSELVRCSGTQFDPEIVRAILAKSTLHQAATLVDRPSELQTDFPALSSA